MASQKLASYAAIAVLAVVAFGAGLQSGLRKPAEPLVRHDKVHFPAGFNEIRSEAGGAEKQQLAQRRQAQVPHQQEAQVLRLPEQVRQLEADLRQRPVREHQHSEHKHNRSYVTMAAGKGRAGDAQAVEGAPPPGSHYQDPGYGAPMVAVCLGYTTKTSAKNRPKQAVLGIKGQSPLFNNLMPSLCRTRSPGFRYSVFIGFDHDDPLLSKEGVADFARLALDNHVPGCKMPVHFIKMNYSGNPTWAQVMRSQGWTDKFVKALSEMNPPFVGVVGPHHSGGNTRILTYDFTSRKHVEIFGFHYPREFRSWWGDDWITLVYQPGRMRKLPGVKLEHKLEAIRYHVGEDKAKLGILQREVDKYRAVLRDWLEDNPEG